MPDHHENRISISGTITHVFGHRFVLNTARGPVLADITPKGLERCPLRVGQDVQIVGETKPSEVKVTRLTSAGTVIEIEHKKKPHEKDGGHHGHHADPAASLTSARAAGFAVLGVPRRKPKHFEILARRDGEFHELHVEFDGHIRKSKPVSTMDGKWTAEMDATRRNA